MGFWDVRFPLVETVLQYFRFRTERVARLLRLHNEVVNQEVMKATEGTGTLASTLTVFVVAGTSVTEVGMACAGGDLYIAFQIEN
jgi:hypothetical protein